MAKPPDQFLCPDSWLLTAQNPPPWAQKRRKQDFSGAGRTQARKVKEIYYDLEEEDLPPPPPYWGTRRGPPEQAEGTREEADFPPLPPPVEEVSPPPTVPTLYPPLPSSEEGERESQVRRRLRSTKEP